MSISDSRSWYRIYPGNFFFCQEGLLDSSSSETDPEDSDESEYLPTPQKLMKCYPVEKCPEASERKLCFLDTDALQVFIDQVNSSRTCVTPGCKGNWVPVVITSKGLGGALSVTYRCDGCRIQGARFDTSYQQTGHTSEISEAVKVAFIVSGCTHTTYCKVLQHALGMNAIYAPSFINTIRKMYPIVETMVDDMCEEAMEAMKKMDQKVLGSWSRAVTTADGCWMTRGHHSKNFTFSIRNYFTGALLFRKHLCQKGGDRIIQEPLYKGTSKAAEGYAARLTFAEAKKRGMKVEINWQDADSSSSNAVVESFPDATIMLCGGHAARSHLKQMEALSSLKVFSEGMKKKYKGRYPEVESVTCHCDKTHSPGCGCMSNAFMEQARNNFSQILSKSQSASEFARRLRALYHHVLDEHEWDDGKCEFHAKMVCSCGKCGKLEEHECTGRAYRTRNKLTCPFHALAYRIEIENRADLANSLVHPLLKRGHSNLPEASHSVLIRFRSKHIFLERLHYHLSTDLGLLQANMTYARKEKGPTYHWITDLFERLKLPVYSGVQEALEKFGKLRAKALERKKTEKYKRMRIQRKRSRKTEQGKRQQWSKRHGGDTYGSAESKVVDEKPVKPCRACGSKTHSRSTSKDCPHNKRNQSIPFDDPLEDGGLLEDPTWSDSPDDTCSDSSDNDTSDDSSIMEDLIFDDSWTSTHKADCPPNSRSRCTKRELFPRVAKTFRLGEYCALHRSRMGDKHLVCRVVQIHGSRYKLYCRRGILSENFSSNDLMICPKGDIPLDKWRQSCVILLRDVPKEDLEECLCTLCNTRDFVCVDDDDEVPALEQPDVWVHNQLYTLNDEDRETIRNPRGWLTDIVIAASQLLLLQHYPNVAGFEPPTLQEVRGFKVHSGRFVQIILVERVHWCVVSNIGCQDGTVNVYDTMYRSLSPSIKPIIASLVFTANTQLTIQMMDVQKQNNGSDCGVLAIAIAYDLCAGHDPGQVRYNTVRPHLMTCLENASFNRFPVTGRKRTGGATTSEVIEIFCTCRMPEEDGVDMAECEKCKQWFHKHCMDIPDEVFSSDSEEVHWECRDCCC